MSRYEVYLLVHIAAAATWAGGGLLILARIDTLIVFVVIADMVVKPTGDDVAVLLAMTAVLLVGVALVVARLRRIDARADTAPEVS